MNGTSYHWIVTMTLASGSVFALSHFDGKLALTKVEQGMVRRASAWPSEEAARKDLQLLLDAHPDLEKLGPFKVEKLLEIAEG